MEILSTEPKLDSALFAQLQTKIDEESELRQRLRDIIQSWEKQRSRSRAADVWMLNKYQKDTRSRFYRMFIIHQLLSVSLWLFGYNPCSSLIVGF